MKNEVRCLFFQRYQIKAFAMLNVIKNTLKIGCYQRYPFWLIFKEEMEHLFQNSIFSCSVNQKTGQKRIAQDSRTT
ncbi:hypothetical protein AKJ43_01630 [candidate division MSBL1 archaeon SCGC-AAA261D19]|uniref:Uncharacterized protein n=1 Tax=candidate division MSBL1 archaeon SCGC-AAA261D19 TaxID=1698273 RepID=A0A133V7S9_9EURY|nr:hypothetical protein AKJ43_01630 [candidate division MSBL1 archaeon SCGC-AAA261D19]